MLSRLIFWLGVLSLAGSMPQELDWKPARPDFEWSFPRDHWSHPGFKTEWWYFTGHLTATDGSNRRYGYQFTFFRVGVLPEPPRLESNWTAADLVMGHAALTDLTEGDHVFSEVIYRAAPLLADFPPYPSPVIVRSQSPPGSEGRWILRWNGAAFEFHMRDDRRGVSLNLSATPVKPLVFQGPNGYSRKGSGESSASMYYSFTRLETRGEITRDGAVIPVEGQSWMDQEFGSNQLSERQVGWDWFSMQLEDQREIMIYLLRDESGKVDYGSATVIDSAGRTTYLSAGAVQVNVQDTWTSDETGARYPSSWRITLPSQDLDLTVTPLLPDQENVSRLLPGLFYWEGAVSVQDVSGRIRGRGFVELTGYGEGSRPAL